MIKPADQEEKRNACRLTGLDEQVRGEPAKQGRVRELEACHPSIGKQGR
jgi:hypothetical protein